MNKLQIERDKCRSGLFLYLNNTHIELSHLRHINRSNLKLLEKLICPQITEDDENATFGRDRKFDTFVAFIQEYDCSVSDR